MFTTAFGPQFFYCRIINQCRRCRIGRECSS